MQGRKIPTVVAILSGMASFAYAAPASAQDRPIAVYGEVQSVRAERVRFADLNLASTRDRFRLYHRVGGAIERVCDIDLGRDGLQDRGYYRCTVGAWNAAIPQIRRHALLRMQGRTSLGAAILVIGR